MENQIFSPSRFFAYIKKYSMENHKLLIALSALPFLLMIFYCICFPFIFKIYQTPYVDEILSGNSTYDHMWLQEVEMCRFIWLLIAICCGRFFSLLMTKQSRTALFTCPASSLEKYLTYFIFYVIALPAIFIAGAFIGDAIRVWIYSGTAVKGLLVDYISPSYFFTSAYASPFVLTVIISGGILTQAVFAFGSCVWPKNSIIKTGCFLLAFNIVTSILLMLGLQTVKRITPNSIFKLDWVLTQSQVSTIFNCILIAFAIFFWVLSYFRFKEWEIIKRW